MIMMTHDTPIEHHIARVAEAWPQPGADAPRARVRAPILALTPEGPRYMRLRVAMPHDDFAAALTRPAQYTTLQYGALAPRFLAIATAPARLREAGELEFLVPYETTLGAALGAARVGDAVALSAPEGPGFPVSGQGPLLICVTGSGAAAARALIEQLVMEAPERLPEVFLYQGDQDAASHAYAREAASWRALGATVMLARDDLGAGEAGARYVQHALEVRAPSLTHAHIYLSGARPMLRAVATLLLSRGVDPGRLHTNI